ncbi:hypothetical protein [Rhizobium laguerreae]|uniref:hypothetical protein n=1 Tax=Rhizobium laguerreae TaxID=1076926 RepID=UPI001C92417D|nr:hypothetical protein [Rhizobium laguerreae]MBY3139030.1 DUF1028 domain-containing protein [Rhizobium laguerreae]
MVTAGNLLANDGVPTAMIEAIQLMSGTLGGRFDRRPSMQAEKPAGFGRRAC